MIKFTVVITTYNRLEWLKRAIESALSQSVPCEVVVVDDASDDGTADYLKSLGNSIVSVLHPSNLGHSKSINDGVQAAQGEWIKLLDDDDYLAPNCIEQLATELAQFPGAVICSCQATYVDANNQEIRQTHPLNSQKSCLIPQEDIHYNMLIEQLAFGTPVQVSVQKEAFMKSGGWDSAFDGNFDDIEFWTRITEYGDALFVNQCLVYRTIWSGNCSGQLPLQKRLDANILIKQRLYERVHPKYQERIPKSQDVYTFLKLYWGLIGLKNQRVSEGFKLLSSSLLYPASWFSLTRVLYSKKVKPLFEKV